jgi:hypothetical protein
MAYLDEELAVFEDELLEAWRDLPRLPDPERAFLSAGSRSCMPQVLRDPVTDYPGDEKPRRGGCNPREMKRLRMMVIGEGCLTSLIEPARAKLVGKVLDLKAWPDRRGFDWSTIWQQMGGKRCQATTAQLESRYKTQLERMFHEWKRRLGGGEINMEALALLTSAIGKVQALNGRTGPVEPGEYAEALAAMQRAEAALAMKGVAA